MANLNGSPVGYVAVDATVNQDTYGYVQEVTFNPTSGAISNSTQIDLSALLPGANSIAAVMYDVSSFPDAVGTQNLTAVAPGSSPSSNDDLEVSNEQVGFSGAFETYLQNTYGPFTATYTGWSYDFNGYNYPIVAVQVLAGDGGGSTHYFALTNQSDPIASSVTTSLQPYYYSCFEKNTLIATPSGDVVVSGLKIGDKVLTQDGRAVDIKWIGYQAINAFFAKKHDSMPIKICADALGDGLPKNDLYVSPDHAFLLDDLLVNASALVNGASITQMQTWAGNVEYYHIETEDHEIILAEGVPAETLLDNSGREKFANYKEFQELYPQGKFTKELDFPRVKFPRQLPEQIKKRLAAYQGATEMAA